MNIFINVFISKSTGFKIYGRLQQVGAGYGLRKIYYRIFIHSPRNLYKAKNMRNFREHYRYISFTLFRATYHREQKNGSWRGVGKRKKGKLEEKESIHENGKGKAEGKKDWRIRKKYRTKKS